MALLLPTSGLSTGPTLIDAQCTINEQVDDLVYISGPMVGNLFQVRQVDIEDAGKIPVVGIVKSKVGTNQCTVRLSGLHTTSGLTSGGVYFAGISGSIVLGPPGNPTSGIRHWQIIGTALSTTKLMVNIQSPYRIIP